MDGMMSIGHGDLAGMALEQKTQRFLKGATHSTPEEAAYRMEALFATMLVKELRSSLTDGGFFGSGPGADSFNAMMDEQLGEQLAKRGALDIAGLVKVALTSDQQRAAAQQRGGV